MIKKNIALAQQVVEEILSGIEAGSLVHGDGLLPSEAELSQRFSVSRSTLREALSKLEQRGVIFRRHGVGTFVAPPPPVFESGLEELVSIETLARRAGLQTSMGEAEIEERPCTPIEMELFQAPAGTPVMSVRRTILAGGRPLAYLVDILPTQFLKKSDLAESFSGSILDLLQRGPAALSHARTEILVERAGAVTCAKLGLRKNTSLLKMEALLYAVDGRTIAYSLSYFVPGSFRFFVIRRVTSANNGEWKDKFSHTHLPVGND